MTILCATDFSPNGNEAARVAALLAAAHRTDMLLLHVLELGGAENVFLGRDDEPGGPTRARIDEEAKRADARLHDEARRLAPFGVTVKTELANGLVDESTVLRAERAHADLVVVGALGRRTVGKWALGSHADRIAQRCQRHVLVVRDGSPFERWVSAIEPLRVLVAVDSSSTSDAAVAWAKGLGALGPCEVIGAHVYWPPEQRAPPQGNDARAMPIGRGHTHVEVALADELRARLAALPGAERVELRLVGGLGRPADHLVQIARDENIQLVVVGNHRRTGIDRMWHGSVSRGLIDLAPCNVVCVPSSVTAHPQHRAVSIGGPTPRSIDR